MSLETIINPAGKNHSIKEAVISLFLANPIIKPERFQQLIELDFKDRFQKFETINQVELQVQNPVGGLPTLNQQILSNVGFKFQSFEKGLNVKALQGINERARNFISYHSLDYTRWQSFYSDYLDVIKIVSKFHPELFVTALSLHYIDQFSWISAEPIDLNKLFNKGGNYIPNDFFSSTVNNYSIVTEKYIDGELYVNRLEIKIEHNIRPMITISHNVTQPLKDVVELRELLASEKFTTILNTSHTHNKEILFDILTFDVKEMIKLKMNTNG